MFVKSSLKDKIFLVYNLNYQIKILLKNNKQKKTLCKGIGTFH